MSNRRSDSQATPFVEQFEAYFADLNDRLVPERQVKTAVTFYGSSRCIEYQQPFRKDADIAITVGADKQRSYYVRIEFDKGYPAPYVRLVQAWPNGLPSLDDVDLLALSTKPEDVMKAFTKAALSKGWLKLVRPPSQSPKM